MGKNESKIVRVNSLQALFDLSVANKALRQSVCLMISEIEKDSIPSLNAGLKN